MEQIVEFGFKLWKVHKYLKKINKSLLIIIISKYYLKISFNPTAHRSALKFSHIL